MRTLLVLDVDGTLVDADGGIYPAAAECIAAVASAGDAVVALSSARPPWSLRGLAAGLGAHISWISSYQGARVEKRSDVEHDWMIVRDVAMGTVEVAQLASRADERWSVWWYTSEHWVVTDVDEAALIESRIVGYRWSYASRRPPRQPIYKALLIGADDVHDVVSGLAGLRAVKSKPGYNEVVSATVPDDKGVEHLRAHSGADRVVVVGDGPNDIGMIRSADVGYTFADAPPLVRTAASHVVSADRSVAYAQIRADLAE